MPKYTDTTVVISSKLELKDLREAERLARYRYLFVVRAVVEKHVWIIGASAVVLTWTNLTARTHESWKGIIFLYGLVFGALVLRAVWMEMRLRERLQKLNRSEVGLEIRADGVYFHLTDGTRRLAPWEKYLDARFGKRVLTLFYEPAKRGRFGRRKYFIVPIAGLKPAERREILMQLPERLRSREMQRAIEQWRLA